MARQERAAIAADVFGPQPGQKASLPASAQPQLVQNFAAPEIGGGRAGASCGVVRTRSYSPGSIQQRNSLARITVHGWVSPMMLSAFAIQSRRLTSNPAKSFACAMKSSLLNFPKYLCGSPASFTIAPIATLAS